MKPKILIVSGATATGKTSLAVHIANKFNGELIGADSRQIYQEMDIVTGKDLPENTKFIQDFNLSKQLDLQIGRYSFEEVSVWGLDLVKSNQEFSIFHFYKFLQLIIKDILSRGKLPIIVGGTGFYLKILWEPLETLTIPQNCSLRNDLNILSVNNLQGRLRSVDLLKFSQMNNSDQNNPRRLIRAIEVAEYKTQNFREIPISHKFDFDLLHLNLNAEIRLIEEKIKQRVLERIRLGAVDETRNLLKKNNSNSMSMSALGYKEIRSFLKNEITETELINLWSLHELQYAKRQITWFRKIKNIIKIDVEKADYLSKSKLLVQKWLNNG